MFKNWIIKYFQGGYLKSLYPEVSKKEAFVLMNIIPDAHCIKCVKGLFKGKVIYKFNKDKMKLLPQQETMLHWTLEGIKNGFIAGR